MNSLEKLGLKQVLLPKNRKNELLYADKMIGVNIQFEDNNNPFIHLMFYQKTISSDYLVKINNAINEIIESEEV